MADRPVWQEAASFAARVHRHHVRKDGATPYVAHVFRVALTVRDVFECDDPVALCAALLHDTIEDTPTDYDDLEERFGTEVADCVAALTKNMIMREDEREPDYDRRLAAAPWQARLVKLADTYDNFCDLPTTTYGERGLSRVVDRCTRALTLVEDDRQDEIRRAVGRVQGLVEESVQLMDRIKRAPSVQK